MEKAKKEQIVENDVDSINTASYSEQEYVYIPDIPAQMDEVNPDNKSTTANAEIKMVVKKSDEVEFLERILNIQEQGGFGRHLHDLIYERIKSLK
jgi:hypothetical protein